MKKEKFPQNTDEEVSGLEDVDALDAGVVSAGPESGDEADALDPETGLPLEEAPLSGLSVEGDNEEE